jgi:hypothetical protein
LADACDFNCECGALRNHVGDQKSSAGGERRDERDRNAGHLIPKFMIFIQKGFIEPVSKANSAMFGRNQSIVDDNGITQKNKYKIKIGPSERFQ